MRINRAIMRMDGMVVTINGRNFWNETKYTILERGYATYVFCGKMTPEIYQWISENGETLHADLDEKGNTISNEICTSGEMLLTSDPILFALAYEAWWAQNGRPLPLGKRLPIPLYRESVVIMRTREILNDFNSKHAGTVPESIRRWAS